MNERFVVLGVAPARREWFRRVGKWANEAALPVEFIKCISVDEVQSRLESGRPFSALLIDSSTPGLGRDILELASSLGCGPIIIDNGLVDRDWRELGAQASLPDTFEASDLRSTLADNANPIRQTNATTGAEIFDDVAAPAAGRAAVITVTGAGGMGTSTLAMAAAQGLAAKHKERTPILLADMALRSNQAMLHDTRDVVPGLLEFIDAHRLGVPNREDTPASIHTFPERNYDLLLGLRNERDWVSISSRSLSAGWSTLLAQYNTVICDVTGDFDGAEETGSEDIEDRNRLARMAARQSDLVVIVGVPGAWGIHHLVRTILSLSEIGIACSRMLPVINHAPRQQRARSGMTSAIADLTITRISDAADLAGPTFIPTRKGLEATLRDGDPLPGAITGKLASSIDALVDLQPQIEIDLTAEPEPVAVAPGSLGTWSEEDV